MSRKTNEKNLRKLRKKLEKVAKKTLISGLILALLSQIWDPKSFFVVLPLLNVRNFCKLSLYDISRKTNDPNSFCA